MASESPNMEKSPSHSVPSRTPAKPLLHYLPPWVRNNLNSSSYKLLFRSWLAAWASFILILPNSSLRTFGNAAFFACMTVILIPPAYPVQMYLFGVGIMVLGSLFGWAWGCLAMKVSLSARNQVLLLSQIQLAKQTAAASANPDALFLLEVFQGRFLDPRSSVVYGIFFAVGVFILAVARTSSPALLLFSVFGTIFLDIICSYGPLFPAANYTILQSFVSSTAASIAISCAVILIVFPETLNHVFLNGVVGLITVMRQLIELQERVLTISDSEELKPTSEIALKIRSLLSDTLSGFQKLSASTGMLSVEFSYGRFNGEDVLSLLEPLAVLNSRIAGLQNLSRLIGTKDIQHIKVSSTDHAGAFPTTHNDPVYGGDGYVLRVLGDHSETSSRKSEKDVLQLIVLPTLRTATLDLRQSCVEALGAAGKLITSVNGTRWRISGEPEPDLDACIDKIRSSLAQFKSTGRLEIVRIFKDSATPSSKPETNFPQWALFYAFVFQSNLVWVAEGVLNLLETLTEIARKRPRARLWAPKSFRAVWKLVTANDDPGETSFNEDDPPINPVEAQRAQMTEKRDPDSKPPTNVFQHAGAFIIRCFAWCQTPRALYAFKYTIVSVALWLPGVFQTSAFFNYTNKGVWALIMAQTTIEPYIADQIYSYIGRLTATIVGVIIGLVGWYIGAGNGGGSPFGIAAVMGVILVPLMFWRVFTPSIVPAIIGGVTTLLIIGYSWIDSHLQLLGNSGVGWPVAWRRCLLVLIGSGASAIMMFIPPRSARREVRHSNAALVFKLSQLYGLLISEWIVVEEETELGGKQKKRIPDESRRWSDKFRRDFTKVGAEVLALRARTSLARWEGSVKGAWPVKEYEELNNVESDMLFYIAQLAGAVYHLEPVWRTRLLHRTKFLNPDFISEVMSVFSLVSRSLRTGEPLQETLPKDLLSRVFYHYQRSHPKDIEDPVTANDHWEHLESPEYMSFAAGVTAVYKILSLLDRLHQITAELCGEVSLRGFSEWKELHDMKGA